jgi:hypothetical protein
MDDELDNESADRVAPQKAVKVAYNLDVRRRPSTP